MKWLTNSNFELALQNPDILADVGPARSWFDSAAIDVNNLEERRGIEEDDLPIINHKQTGLPPRPI